MDCESCGRHRPSDEVVATWAGKGAVLMLCGRCRRHAAHRAPHAGPRPAVDGGRPAPSAA